MNMARVIAVVLGLLTAASAMADSIPGFNSSWAGRALARQRMLDQSSPLINNNILAQQL